jgi:TonB family protein
MKARAAPHPPASADQAARSETPAGAPRAAGAPRSFLSIVALSQDPMLLEALALAVVGQASVVSSPSADRFADQLVATAAAVALIDTAVAPEPLDQFIAGVHRQFPQLLLLLAGPAALQTQFAAQLADGTIFRLAHKPASAQRLKLFVDAALLRRQALIDQATAAPLPGAAAIADANVPALGARSGRRRGPWLLAAGLLLAVAAALGGLLWRRPFTGSTSSTSSGVTGAVSGAADRSASEATTTPTAANPVNPATAASQEEAERDAIDRAAAERAERDRLISENQRREAELAEQVRRTAASARVEQAHVYVQLAKKRLASGALLTPADDSARSYVQSALALAPSDAEVQAVAAALEAALRAQSAPAVTPASIPASVPGAEVTDVIPEASLQRTQFVPPVYPPEALSKGISGTVDLEFTVTPAGDVSDIAVQAAEPSGVFEQAAIAALSHSRYRPVQRDGVAIAQRARVRLRFQP